MTVNHIYTDLEFSLDFEVRSEALEELEARIKTAAVSTRAALPPIAANADRFQRSVIEAPGNTIRVLAPAGSGKTQTVINRVMNQIREGVHPSRLLVLTFDNAASSSLKSKLDAFEATAADLAGLTISTLNAFGLGVLREYFPTEPNRLIKPWQQRSILREIKEELRQKSAERHAALPGHLADRFYLDFFGLLKNQLFDPRRPDPQRLADFMLGRPQAEPFLTDPSDKDLIVKIIQAVGWLFMAHERAMQRDRVIDFDDQKLRPYVLLTDSPPLLRVVQGKYAEVVVDEFQDINLLDFSFIKAIAARANLVVTGDDDQAIYGFRGCSPDYIIDLEEHLGRPFDSYELSINYRCPPNIVEHADRLIRHNTRRIAKNPVPHLKTPSDIQVVSTLSAGLEAKSIVAFIKRVKTEQPSLNYSDFAVLYRTNAQSLPLQVEFILSGLPYYVRDEDNILENEALDRLLGLLWLKLALRANRKPTMDQAMAAVASYFRFVDPGSDEQLRAMFARGGDFLTRITSRQFYEILPKAEQSQFAPAVRAMLDARTLLDTFDVISKRFNGLKGMVGSLEDALDDGEPLAEIYEVAANLGGDVADFLNVMEDARTRARISKAGTDQRGVALLTYFKSKGLQWHTVILTTCNEGLIPHKKAAIRGTIEDERRLFYVAMTRSSANLLISYVDNACNARVAPIRFLTEADLL